MRRGLGWVCASGNVHSIGNMEFPKFQTGIFVEWKASLVLNPSCLHKISYFGDYITCNNLLVSIEKSWLLSNTLAVDTKVNSNLFTTSTLETEVTGRWPAWRVVAGRGGM